MPGLLTQLFLEMIAVQVPPTELAFLLLDISTFSPVLAVEPYTSYLTPSVPQCLYGHNEYNNNILLLGWEVQYNP